MRAASENAVSLPVTWESLFICPPLKRKKKKKNSLLLILSGRIVSSWSFFTAACFSSGSPTLGSQRAGSGPVQVASSQPCPRHPPNQADRYDRRMGRVTSRRGRAWLLACSLGGQGGFDGYPHTGWLLKRSHVTGPVEWPCLPTVL